MPAMREMNSVIQNSRRSLFREQIGAAERSPARCLRGRNLWITLGALAFTSMTTAGFTLTWAFGDNLLAAAMQREARMVERYEGHLATLRAKLDRAASRESVTRAKLQQRVERLARRDTRLTELAIASPPARIVTGATHVGLRAGEKTAPDDVVDTITASLKEAEAMQLRDLATLRKRATVHAERLSKILRLHGVAAPETATGGPLIELKWGDAFDEEFAAYEAASTQLDRVRRLAQGLPQGSPVRGRPISSRFGARRDPITGRRAMHGGMDFRAPKGFRVRATGAGKVRFAGRKGGYGLLVEIKHVGGLVTRYAHLSRITVRKGQQLARGEEVGRVGSTGRSTGPHLHYEVRRKGQARNPDHYVRLGRILAPLL